MPTDSWHRARVPPRRASAPFERAPPPPSAAALEREAARDGRARGAAADGGDEAELLPTLEYTVEIEEPAAIAISSAIGGKGKGAGGRGRGGGRGGCVCAPARWATEEVSFESYADSDIDEWGDVDETSRQRKGKDRRTRRRLNPERARSNRIEVHLYRFGQPRAQMAHLYQVSVSYVCTELYQYSLAASYSHPRPPRRSRSPQIVAEPKALSASGRLSACLFSSFFR